MMCCYDNQSGNGNSPVPFDACGDDFVMVESEDEGEEEGDDGDTKHTDKSESSAINLPSEIVNLARRFRYPGLERPAATPLRASSRVELCSSLRSRWRLPVPALRILIMAVGTR
jgi:hypothetical protein